MLPHADLVTVNGLPLHPLVVHATVVLLPVTALLALLYVYRANTGSRLKPREDGKLRVALLVLAVGCAALVWLTRFSGFQLRDALGMPVAVVRRHEVWADRLAWATYAFALVAVVVSFRDQRADWMRGLLHALLVVAAVTVVVLCAFAGDAGARLVYGSVSSR
ncbi:DUF2231 domain-containing protein [Nocardioides maradonensis]